MQVSGSGLSVLMVMIGFSFTGMRFPACVLRHSMGALQLLHLAVMIGSPFV
jgi:hypothetical protein